MSESTVFPALSDVPPEFHPAVVEQNSFLVNGEMKPWTGAMQDVFSPIFQPSSLGLSPLRLGSFPLLDATATDEVLEAATKAYDLGRGVWPTMSVKNRINHMLSFVKRMK